MSTVIFQFIKACSIDERKYLKIQDYMPYIIYSILLFVLFGVDTLKENINNAIKYLLENLTIYLKRYLNKFKKSYKIFLFPYFSFVHVLIFIIS